MNKAFERLKSFNWYDILLILLLILFFRQAIISIWLTFTSPEFYDNGIGFILVSVIFALSAFKKKYILAPREQIIPLISLLGVLSLYTINGLFLRLSIVPAILFLFGVYSLLGFYFERQFWKRSIFIFAILVLTLPLLERVQKFLGFPIRLATANIVSSILQITGIGNVSNSAVIISENHATSIDLPCSGVKSMYTGTLFMTSVYYLQKVRLSITGLLIASLFLVSLLFFNIWRVFSLVYIYDVLQMKSVGNAIHLLLGIVGFIASCSLLWYLTKKYAPVLQEKPEINQAQENTAKENIKILAIIILVLFTLFQYFFIKNPPVVLHKITNQQPFRLPTIQLTPVPFSPAEATYFVTNDVEFSKKFTGKTTGGIQFSLLVVSSKSARTHHDPEICLQGLGHTITNNEIFQLNDFRIRKLSLDDDTSTALYWFVGKDKNLLDYSERVWEEIKNPKQKWVVILIGFSQPISLSKPEIKEVLLQINNEAKTLL